MAMNTAVPGMTVLERQRARVMTWQQEQHQQQEQGSALFRQQGQSQSFFNGGGGSSASFSLGGEDLMGLGEVVNQCKMIGASTEMDFWGQLGKVELPCFGYEASSGSISRTASCPPVVPAAAAAAEKVGAPAGKDGFRKRKLERVQSARGYEEETRDKKIKGCSGKMDSNITEQSNNNNNYGNKNIKNSNKESSGITSKDNSKASEDKKPDYIHVRARRGQATDSHSLAERVRREKISERMKFLQDLVPGCNKITGKAGMLDEIINYVQSLQRQVEFLSMKLATMNPRLDFDIDIDSLFSKEMIPATTSSFPTVDILSDLTNPTYLHFDPAQQLVSCSGLNMGIIDPDIGLKRSTSTPVPVPEPFIDSSCFNQMNPTAMWESDFHSLYDSTTYQPHQQYTGSIEAATTMKMEI